MAMPPRARATRPPRVKHDRVEPVTTRRIPPSPDALVDIGHVSLDPLPEWDIPPRLRVVHPVAVSVGYRLAKGNWERVKPIVNAHGMVVDWQSVIVH